MAVNADGTQVEDTQDVQTQQETVTLEQHKALESEYTRVRQGQIEALAEIATANPKKILELTDYKLQNAVVKRIYGLDNLQAVKAVYGENFLEAKKEEKEIDDTEKFRRELNVLKYSQEQDKLSAEINLLKLGNPHLNNEEAMEKLNEELKSISKDLPVAERVKKAAMLAFPASTADEAAMAYKKLAELNVSGGSGGYAGNSGTQVDPAKKAGEELAKIKARMGWK